MESTTEYPKGDPSRTILDDLSEGCQIIGFDWKYRYVNDAAARHARRPKEEMVGRKYTDVWPGIEAADVVEIIRQCKDERIPRRTESEFTFPDGEVGWLQLSIQPVHDGVLILSSDITGRRRAEEEFRRRSEELAALNAMGEELGKRLSLDHVMRVATAQIASVVHADLTFFFVREGTRLVLKSIDPADQITVFEGGHQHRVGVCICGLAVAHGTPIYSRNLCADPRCTWEECKSAGLYSLAALPIFADENVAGVIGMASKTERDFEKQAAFL
jgi:PAS domain S-box-containing protein